MFKRNLAFSLAAFLSFTANASWVGGVSYTSISDGDDGITIDLGAITASVGYQFQTSEQFSIVPEVRLGFGISDDEISGVELSLKRFLALSVRGEYALNEKFYVFAAPSYANLEVEASFDRFSNTEDAWEFGIGAGVGYQLSDTVNAEVSYENYDGSDVISAGLKFSF
ncbi:MAG: opacity protein-like surface antigen [Paraglaciecola sp.]|jgi:opacity protein-like surface antigen